MAYSAISEGNLLNLDYERASAGEFVAITFSVPERYFHIEFYEPIATTPSARSYRYPTSDADTIVAPFVGNPIAGAGILTPFSAAQR